MLKLFLSTLFLVLFSGCEDDHSYEHSHEHTHEALEVAGEKEQNQTKEENTSVIVLDKNESEVEDANRSSETYSIFKIKQTTQIESYDEFGNIDINLQDDGFYKKGETPEYTRDANKSIVTDMLTGLMWQDDEVAQREWKSIDGLDENATSYCSKLELGAYDDWRVPSRYELLDIVNYGSNETIFQNIASGFFWTSSTYEINSLNNWAVDFEAGLAKQKLNTTSLHLRCVRGKKLEEKSTKLKWHDDKDINDFKTWHEAISYCEELEVDGDGWRLANINELKSIIDDSSFNPASKEDILAKVYWSGTSYASSHTVAWVIDFYTAEISLNDKSGEKLVRCVK